MVFVEGIRPNLLSVRTFSGGRLPGTGWAKVRGFHGV
jgi:hypothetical protein